MDMGMEWDGEAFGAHAVEAEAAAAERNSEARKAQYRLRIGSQILRREMSWSVCLFVIAKGGRGRRC